MLRRNKCKEAEDIRGEDEFGFRRSRGCWK